MLSEIKVALRGLAKSPGFTAIAIATLAFLSTRALSALLYSVGAFDAATFVFVTFALAATALRATRADPMIALSHNL